MSTIIFDLDGTLVNSMPLHIEAFIKTLQKNGYKVNKKKMKKDIDKFRGMTGMKILQVLTGKKNVEKLYNEKKKYLLDRMNKIKEMRGASKTLKKLRERGYNIVVVTSSKKYFADLIFTKYNWDFDMVLTADNVKNPKPHTEPYEIVMKKFGKPEVIVGDGINDEIPAKVMGLKFLRFGRDIKKLDQIFKHLA